MSASVIVQNGPASTRVRSSTRTPESGLVRATFASLEEPAHDAAGHRINAIAGTAGAAPEQARAIERVQARKVVDVVDRLDGDERADAHTWRLSAVTDEASAALELDERDVERRAKALGGRVQRRVRHDLSHAGHRGRRHPRRMVRAVRGRRRDDEATTRAARRRDALDHCIEESASSLSRGWPGLGAGWLRTFSRLIVGAEWRRNSSRLIEGAGWLRSSSRFIIGLLPAA